MTSTLRVTMKHDSITLEICIDSVQGAITASQGGADRLELCGALSEGGITPSYGLVQQVLDAVNIPVMMMIRCRGGSFVYSDSEVEVMLHDIDAAKALGVHGVVFGALLDDDTIDLKTTKRLADAARPMSVTFHRAFDERGVEAMATLKNLDALGIDRLLTSGQQAAAIDGIERIAELVPQSGNVAVMPGAGVRPENAAEIIRATGAREIHGTASRFCEQLQRRVTCIETVRAIRAKLDAISAT